MNKQITFKAKSIYGNTVYYPTCTIGQALCAIAGTKTLTYTIESQMSALGFELVKIEL